MAGSAIAATVPLNGRSFDSACAAAAAGDTITVPAGSYGGTRITCQKAVTFQLDANARLASLDFSGANGPTVSGGIIIGDSDSGAASIMNSTNVTLRDAHINNMVYVEGSVNSSIVRNVIEPGPGGSVWSNGDMIDVYEQTRSRSNTGLTIADNVLHGLRAPGPAAHSDAIQFCNCGNPDQIPTNIKIQRNRFYDNECMNIRTNDRDGLLIEQNIFGDTMEGVSGCGAYSLDVLAASATVRYNTFVGDQKIQVNTSADVGQSQTWVGNVGVGMSTDCGAIRGTYSHNVWTDQKCGATDKQVSSLKLNNDGTPQTGSPVIDAGDPASYPAQDFNGGNRWIGAGPDAGAFELGSGSTPGVGPPEPTPGPIGGGTPGKPGAPAPPGAPSKPGTGGSGSGNNGGASGGADGATAGTAASGLVAAFGFDERSGKSVLDSSGGGLNGVRRGTTRVANGRFGRALSFDGAGDRVTVPDSARLRLSAGLTLEAWVRPTSATGQRLVLLKGNRKGLTYGLYASDLGRVPSGAVRTAGPATAASRTLHARAKARLPLGRWSNVAVTFSGNRVRIYVNGIWISSRTAPGALVRSAGALRIGGGLSDATSFRGRIDEVRVYDRALTGAQIQSDSKSPVSG
ncbi:MAG: LamG domain-containing protein [Baekduia sp.]